MKPPARRQPLTEEGLVDLRGVLREIGDAHDEEAARRLHLPTPS